MIYIDTSAVLKLVHPEAESVALRTWLATHPDDLVSSALVRTEARRALLRYDPGALPGLPGHSGGNRADPGERGHPGLGRDVA